MITAPSLEAQSHPLIVLIDGEQGCARFSEASGNNGIVLGSNESEVEMQIRVGECVEHGFRGARFEIGDGSPDESAEFQIAEQLGECPAA